MGLGNPGERYRRTRHNAGFMVVDLLAGRSQAHFRQAGEAALAQAELAGQRVLLVKPLTFMNRSGAAVEPLVRSTHTAPADVLVVLDDVALDLGTLRLRQLGSHGGHNGLRSVADALGSKEFQRVRVGIGRPPGRKDPAAFVLEGFTGTERAQVPTICEQAADATELLVELGLEAAQNRVHAW